MADIPSIGELKSQLFLIAKSRFEQADVWEGVADVESIKEITDVAASATHTLLKAQTPEEKQSAQETLDILGEAIEFKITEKGIKLNKFGSSLLKEVISIATKTIVSVVVGML